MGADSVVKLLQCYPHVELNDLDVIDYLVEQLNTKLATGEAFAELSGDDYTKLAACLKDHPNSPLTPQVLQKVQDYVLTNSAQFTIEERNSIIRSISSMRFKSNYASPHKQTPSEVKNAIRTGLGIKESKDVDVNYSPVEDCYSMYFHNTKTRL